MYRSIPQSQIRPKIGSMPRQKTEASACLDVYKLVVEKKRLEQELEKIEQRRVLIQKRIGQLNQQIGHLDDKIQEFREPSPEQPPTPSNARPAETVTESGFGTFTLEY